MKKNLMFAMFGAIALTGAVGLSSCTDSDEVVNVNPGYNEKTGEVPVNFVFNVSTSNTPTTRMSAANTQANLSNSFRGLTSSVLWTFKIGTTTDGVFSPSDGNIVNYSDASLASDLSSNTYTGPVLDKSFSLGTIIAKNGISQTQADPTVETPNPPVTGTSHRILELSLPTGTNSLLFWGKAVKDANSDSDQGKVTWNMGSNLKDISISLNNVVSDDDQSYFEEYQKLISSVLTKVVNAEINKIVAATLDDGTEVTTSTAVNIKWSDYVTITQKSDDATTVDFDESVFPASIVKKTTSVINSTDPVTGTLNPIGALGEILANSYVTLNTIYENELRAGCAFSVRSMMEDLYSVIYPVAKASPISLDEVVAKEVAKEIIEEIENTFTVQKPDPDDGTYTFVNWNHPKKIISNNAFAVADYPTLKEEDSNSNLVLFPQNFNLPLGAVILTFYKGSDNTFKYDYLNAIPTYAMGTAGGSFNPRNYVYPPELCYFGNSPVRVSDLAHVATDYPDGSSNWMDNSSWAQQTAGNTDWVSGEGNKGSHVVSSTRSVAMKNNIQYGTALLKSSVKYSGATLYDNNKKIQSERFHVDEEDHVIVPTASDGFVLTGVLIGGQAKTVGWNFLSNNTEEGFGYMVYDCSLPDANDAISEDGIAVPLSTPTPPNYTLVWDNWDRALADGDQRTVYVALEFKNNVQDFWGKNNLIRKGGTFYLIGKLDPDKPDGTNSLGSDKSAGITWPTEYSIPPYDGDGATIKKRRVFIQDYMTDATFVIGTKSLQEALVAVPDLRSSQISLGLSVDLKWQTGLDFGEVILGK